MSAVNFFKKNGHEIGALLFDGMMISKKKEINDDILKSLMTYVKKETEYNVKFIIKPMEHPSPACSYMSPRMRRMISPSESIN